MAEDGATASGSARAKRFRAKRRADGLRLVQLWVPDMNAASFAEEARRQSLAIRNSPSEAEDQAWVDGISDAF